MALSPIAARSYITIVGCAAGFGVFGWLRYYWVQHEVAWRPEARYWQYLLPCAAGLVLLILGRGGGRDPRTAGLTRLLRLVWPVGMGGVLLAIGQWQFALQGPWLLYLWMGLLTWGTWRVAPRLHLAEPSRRQLWLGIAVATIGMIALHVAMQLELWRLLSFGYRDIGLFARALHNAAQGQGLWVDSLERSILGEHAFFALWALVPLCKLGADPFRLLVALSAVCLSGPALIVAWYVRRRFASNAAAVLAALAWLLLPAHGCLVLAQSYGFHPLYMAVPLLLAGMALGSLGRWRAAAVCMLLCLTIREDIALTVAAWGVFVFFVPKRRLLGTVVFGAAVAYLVVAVTLIVPHYRGEPYPHIAFHFSRLVEDGSLVRSLLVNLSFLLTLLLPLACLPLRSWRWACVALPSLAEAMLTTNIDLHNLCFQYYTPAMVVLFFASLEAWMNTAAPLQTVGRPATRRQLRWGWCLLGSAVVGQLYLGVGPVSSNPVRPFSPSSLRVGIDNIRRVRSMLPEEASVTASYRIAAHFLDAIRLWTVKNERLGDVVIIHDLDNRDASKPREALVRAFRTGGYQPALADYHLVMLIRDSKPTPLARELMPERLPDGVTPLSFDMGQGIEWVGMGIYPVEGSARENREYHVTLIWHCRQRVDADYRFGLMLGEGRTRWGPFYFARGALPTVVWEPGRLYRDDIDIRLPAAEFSNLRDLKPILLKQRNP